MTELIRQLLIKMAIAWLQRKVDKLGQKIEKAQTKLDGHKSKYLDMEP